MTVAVAAGIPQESQAQPGRCGKDHERRSIGCELLGERCYPALPEVLGEAGEDLWSIRGGPAQGG